EPAQAPQYLLAVHQLEVLLAVAVGNRAPSAPACRDLYARAEVLVGEDLHASASSHHNLIVRSRIDGVRGESGAAITKHDRALTVCRPRVLPDRDRELTAGAVLQADRDGEITVG